MRVKGTNNPEILVGTSSKDVITGAGGDDGINGLQGNDIMSGGDGADIFVFYPTFDSDKIKDFTPGEDMLDIGPYYSRDFDEIMENATQRGKNVVFDFGDGDKLTLIGVDIDDLSPSDFL